MGTWHLQSVGGRRGALLQDGARLQTEVCLLWGEHLLSSQTISGGVRRRGDNVPRQLMYCSVLGCENVAGLQVQMILCSVSWAE